MPDLIDVFFCLTLDDKEMQRLQDLLEKWNRDLYNPVGVNIRWPREVAFLFVSAIFFRHGATDINDYSLQLEIEYYVSPITI